ncbi:hypothetical protein T458_24485 [Brevibacillus panacihumi W25]|uniref:Protein kinase domain-containing protein n=1 Tax=Brevibacillus panacihumi W25 TaxID=1408254 RepID=V6M0H7_9BACL|nr:phosphotransferase [Brevibacillus panacihumi]EST52176.1 hypothetical protein T458_24485 [Brevibacillus panacihumi W25]
MYDSILRYLSNNYPKISVNTIEKINVDSLNNVYKIKSDQKYFILKFYKNITHSTLERVLKIQSNCSEHNIAPSVLLNEENSFITVEENHMFTMQEYLEGEHPSTECNQHTLNAIAQHMHVMHVVSKNIELPNRKLSKNYEEIMNEIVNYQSYFHTRTSENIAINYISDLLDLRYRIIQKNKISFSPQHLSLTHGDLKPSNIIISHCEGEKVKFIDFDYAGINDLWIEIGRAAVLLSNYDVKKMCYFLECYSFVSKAEFSIEKIIQQLLSYLIQSNFPIYIYDSIKIENLITVVKERIKLINFCLDITK